MQENKEVNESLFTQEQVNKIVGERLAKKEQQVREEVTSKLTEEFTSKYQDYDALKSQISSLEESNKKLLEDKVKYDEDLKSINDLKEKVAQYERESVKSRVANELGLPMDAVQFISGNDEDSIRESAEKLKGIVGHRSMPLASNERPVENDINKAFRNTLKGIRGE